MITITFEKNAPIFVTIYYVYKILKYLEIVQNLFLVNNVLKMIYF